MEGVLAEHVGDDAAARAAYERVLALEPANVVALNQLAWFLAAREIELDRALELAGQADALQPGNASVLDTKGWVLFLGGDEQAAVETLREAHAIDGGQRSLIALHLARAEAAAGDRPRAVAILRELAERDPVRDPVAAEAAALLAELGG
jgi:Flp pilus assembly protein TadD